LTGFISTNTKEHIDDKDQLNWLTNNSRVSLIGN